LYSPTRTITLLLHAEIFTTSVVHHFVGLLILQIRISGCATYGIYHGKRRTKSMICCTSNNQIICTLRSALGQDFKQHFSVLLATDGDIEEGITEIDNYNKNKYILSKIPRRYL